MIKNNLLFSIILLIAIVLAGCGDSSVSSTDDGNQQDIESKVDEGNNEEYVINFAHVVRSSTAKGQAAEKFAELIEARTDGRIKVEVYPDSQLGNDREITEQMQSGTIQMNAPFTGVLPSFVPQFQVFDLPFLFNDRDVAYKAMHGELGVLLNEYLSQQGLRALGYWDGGFKHLTNSVRPIEKPEDMEGLKFRASQSPLLIAQFRALDAGGVSIDFSELYTALQNKTVDGQENPLSNIVSQKFYEVQDYLTLSAHGYMGYVWLISENFYQQLPDDLKQILEEVAKEVTEWQWEQAAANEEKYMEELKASGIQITELTPENREAFIQATRSVYDEFMEIEGSEQLLEAVRKASGN
ncbi:C4-dicarboxylate-binding protein DctP [Caldalkalibacillus uzonensis]|uniref:C4-dicarboxylate-binding protein DctP n=1 Tax=Caldalkalibacillus uzonensis TaxID=353224 RepID=A0ABU0CTE0_9BACI|nr:TRAP transporter substrate-binding protein [Caldalkalibacillus uzonensis]MDQ0339363.1 C4-dicarboxylate-binding protein DctP [Caldalkalibacillus uzonensis]